MGEWSVVPAIRVADMESGVAFYRDQLGFTVERNATEEEATVSLSFRDARIMLDKVPTDFYSAEYNAAIGQRMGGTSPNALYIEAPGIDEFYARVQAAEVRVIDPLADRSWGQREFTIEDPDGNWLSFWEALKAG